MAGKFWKRLNPLQRAGLVLLATVQVGLAVTAAVDLARRPPESVNGPKWRWAAVLPVNFIGPLAYLRWGRRRDGDHQDASGWSAPDETGEEWPPATAPGHRDQPS